MKGRYTPKSTLHRHHDTLLLQPLDGHIPDSLPISLDAAYNQKLAVGSAMCDVIVGCTTSRIRNIRAVGIVEQEHDRSLGELQRSSLQYSEAREFD